MAANETKTTEEDDNSDTIPSIKMCNEIYTELESIIKDSNFDYKNETLVQSKFQSLYESIGQLKNQLLLDNQPAMDKLPSAQLALIRAETDTLPRELLKEGFVEKRGEGPLKGWKKRYLQLYSNKTIDYYTDSTLKELKGTIYLSTTNIKDDKFENAIEINYGINFGFNIHTMKRKWEFKVSSTTTRAQWIKAINDCIEAKGLTYSKGRRHTEAANMKGPSFKGGNLNNQSVPVHSMYGNYGTGNGGANTFHGGNVNNYSAANRLNSPVNNATRQMSNSLSLLGDGAASNEYLKDIQNSLAQAKTAKHETVTMDHETKEMNVPERKFLNIQSNFSGDDLTSADNSDVDAAGAAGGNGNITPMQGPTASGGLPTPGANLDDSATDMIDENAATANNNENNIDNSNHLNSEEQIIQAQDSIDI